ncbi:MAG: hypothetical protein ACFFB2_14545 [Promethearchaeota archaeon]
MIKISHTIIKKLERTPQQNIVIALTGLAAIATIVIFLLMRPVETALKAVSPYGVIELEFAWNIERIHQIFGDWTEDLILQELNVTLLDYVFLIAYSTFLASLTLLVSRRLLTGQLQCIGFYMTLVPFFAAFFDAIENLNLILMLSSPSNFPSFSPLIASISATIKFGLIIIVVIFIVVAILWSLFQRFSDRTE